MCYNVMRLCSLVPVCAVTLGVIASTDLTVSAMTFKPAEGRMWDVCVFHHDGTYYLGYTANSQGVPTGFGVATSSDGVHWKDRGIVRKATGSGFIWKSPDFQKDGKFQYNTVVFSYPGPGQRIGFIESSDLFHWELRDVVFDIDPRWYKTDGRWDCIATTPRPAGGYYGYWTAIPKDGSLGFGFGETTDGVHWKALEPPKVDWGSYESYKPECCEVGGVDVIDGKYHAMINFSRTPGSRMLSLVADRPEGPFVLAKKNPTLFDGDAHFARFFSSPDGMLVVHFSLTKKERDDQPWDTLCYMAPMKRAVVDKEGILRLAYWKGNDKLKGEAVAVKTPLLDGPPALLEPRFDVERGFILEGTIRLPAKESAQLPGVYLESGEPRPTLVRMLSNGASQIGTVKPDGSDFQPRAAEAVYGGLAEIDRQMSFGPTARFRILVRHGMLEFYLDDVLFHIRSLTQPATGKIGIVGAPGSISDLQAWQMDLP